MKEVLTGITWIKRGLLLNWRDGQEDNGNLLLKLLGQVTLVHLVLIWMQVWYCVTGRYLSPIPPGSSHSLGYSGPARL